MIITKDIPGWFSYSKLFDEMISNASENSLFVELGTFKGRSTAHMCNSIFASNKIIKFDAIDWFKGSEEHHNEFSWVYPPEIIDRSSREEWLYQECLANLKPAIDRNVVNLIRMDAKSAVHLYEDDSIDFCFHDASHEYEDLRIEIPLWWNKVKPGGYFAGHDYNNKLFSGIGKVVNQLAYDYNLYVTYRAREDCWLLQKPV